MRGKIVILSIIALIASLILLSQFPNISNDTSKETYILYGGKTVHEIIGLEDNDLSLKLQDKFEKGKIDEINFERAKSESIKYVLDPFSEKNTVMSLTLHPGDVVNNGHRVEFTYNDLQGPGDEYIYAYKFLIDRNYIESDEWQGIMQFHDQPDFLKGETWETYGNKGSKLYPPLMMNYSNGKVNIVHNNKSIQGEPLVEKNVIKDFWNTVVIHYRNGYDDGFVEIYLNGENITNGSVRGQTIYNDVANYIKIGLYRDPLISTTNTIYIDDFSVYKVK